MILTVGLAVPCVVRARAAGTGFSESTKLPAAERFEEPKQDEDEEASEPKQDEGAGEPSPDEESSQEVEDDPGSRSAPPDPTNEATESASFVDLFHGSILLRYRARWTKDTSDQDLHSRLWLDVGDADRHPVTLHVLARGTADLDGSRDREGFFVFDDITDTFDEPVNGRLYDAYLDFHRLPLFEMARLGRQVIYDTPEVAYLDGARLETGDFDFLDSRAGGYAGVPVHLYESSPSGDLTYGAFAQARPWTGARIRTDWMHVDDEDGELFSRHRDDLVGFGVWQSLFEHVQLHGFYSLLEGESRDLSFRGTYYHPGWKLHLQTRYYELLQTQRDHSIDFDPFFAQMFEYHPFRQLTVLVSQGLGDHFTAEVGFDLRRVRRDGDIGRFNRDFERYHITGILRDILEEGLSISATGEVWDSVGRDVVTVGADLSYHLESTFKASLGTYYSYFKYDVLTGQEREDVRTYYGRLDYDVTGSVTAEVLYQLEDDDFDRYHEVRLGVRWSF